MQTKKEIPATPRLLPKMIKDSGDSMRPTARASGMTPEVDLEGTAIIGHPNI
jgi:hypothetical protein